MHNDDVQQMGKLALLRATVWNSNSSARLREAIRTQKADIVHFHNTFPLMSPSVYYAARAEGAAVVQTLHNFRLLCPGANLFRDGKVCEECVGKCVPWNGVKNKCYRSSTVASAGVATLLTVHRGLGTWQNAVDAYIAPTPSARNKFVQGGLPADRIFVKPNFVHPDPGEASGGGGYAVFVGRLSYEKGLETLLAAWETIGSSIPLKIVGDGPLAEMVTNAAARIPGIEWLGRRKMDEVYDIIGKAEMLIFPSRCYETFGRTGIEAFAKGTPVIASNHGAPADVVEHEKTGLLFTPGDGVDLARQAQRLYADPGMRARMRQNARSEFESKYTGRRNYEQLIGVYERAMNRVANAAPAAVGQ